jgi:hypothetical protein
LAIILETKASAGPLEGRQRREILEKLRELLNKLKGASPNRDEVRLPPSAVDARMEREKALPEEAIHLAEALRRLQREMPRGVNVGLLEMGLWVERVEDEVRGKGLHGRHVDEVSQWKLLRNYERGVRELQNRAEMAIDAMVRSIRGGDRDR